MATQLLQSGWTVNDHAWALRSLFLQLMKAGQPREQSRALSTEGGVREPWLPPKGRSD